MDITQLRYFLAVTKEGSFTKASALLRVAQPAITRQVQLLELELGVTLFIRHSRGIEVTSAGASLARRAAAIVSALEEAKREIASTLETPSGQLRVGCTPALTRPLLLTPVKTFLRQYPQVALQLQENISSLLTSAVLAETLDMAIVSRPHDAASLHAVHLFDDPIWIFGPPNILESMRPVDINEIAHHPLMLARPSQTTRELIDKDLRNAANFKLIVEADSVQVIQSLVQSGLGFTISTFSGHRAAFEEKRVSGAPIKGYSVERVLISRSDRARTQAMAEFERLLLANAQI